MSSQANPRVSVIIPLYNAARFIAEAIASVHEQGVSETEIIIIDDGSSDGSAEVARKYAPEATLLAQSNLGAAAARNRGLQAARGEYIAFLDADDRWTSTKLRVQINAFNSDPSLDLVFGQARQLHNGEEWERGVRQPTCPESELMAGLVLGTLLARRESFLRVGLLKTDYRVGEFIDWYMRAVQMGCKIAVLRDLMLWRRIHDSNLGIRERNKVSDYARVLKAGLDRRRAAQSK